MKRNYILAFASAIFLLHSVPGSAVDIWSLSAEDIRSAVKDDATMQHSESRCGVTIQHLASDPALYMNSVDITGGTNWNPAIDLQVGLDYFGFTNGNFEQNTYTLGTGITDDVAWNFDGLVRRSGTVTAAVAPGFYDFNVDIKGGGSSSADDVLASFNLRMEVVQSITAAASATMSPSTLGFGDISQASVNFANTGNRSIITETWYVSAFSLNGANTDFLTFDDFEGDWFDQTIVSGDSRTDLHSKWRATASNAIGTYDGNIGIYGGLYNGDTPSWRASGTLLEVVPEPTSMLALVAGLGLLTSKKKSA